MKRIVGRSPVSQSQLVCSSIDTSKNKNLFRLKKEILLVIQDLLGIRIKEK